jgi:GTP-binding protein HflX
VNSSNPDPTPDERGGEGSTRCFVVQPAFRFSGAKRSSEAMLEEALGLAEAIRLDIRGNRICPVVKPHPAHLLGGGQIEDIGKECKEKGVELVFINHPITPPQQRNLEKAWEAKVIDRTGLILEIFGDRAHTKEGQLQVELAALTYQRSRLVRSWTHLERQRGGFGFLGGPGESQLEIDRRLISTRIIKIKEELDDVRRTRGLHRRARERAEQAVVALVGYTNAGKSTLFNRLTGSEVLAKNMLFATLDPTMRQMALPSGKNIILSDTVGFISDLPTHLVEAFRATLEEVENADVILHVRDISHPDTRAQKEDVDGVLESLGIQRGDTRLIEVLNKIDLLPEDERASTLQQSRRMGRESIAAWGFQGLEANVKSGSAAISAMTGEGLPELLHLLDERLKLGHETHKLRLGYEEGAKLAWLYEHGHILSRNDGTKYMTLEVEFSPANWGRYRAQYEKRKS